VSGRPFAFDLDGTLLTSRERHVAVAREALRAGGEKEATFDGDGFWAAKRAGATTRQALESVGVGAQAAAEAAAVWLDRIEDDEALALDELQPGATEALAASRAAGFPPFVLTARRRTDAVRRQVDRLGLAEALEDLVVVRPDRARGEKARVLEARRPVAFVGDTESDAAAAADAGVPFAAVGTGQRDAAFLRAHGADVVYDGVAEAVAGLRGRLAVS
jgi:phosphoglycolate phosphatase